MTSFVLPRPNGTGWGVYMPKTETWWSGTWEEEDDAAQHREKELARPMRDRLWSWIREHPGGTIGEACREFGLTPLEFLDVRDGKQDPNQRRRQ